VIFHFVLLLNALLHWYLSLNYQRTPLYCFQLYR